MAPIVLFPSCPTKRDAQITSFVMLGFKICASLNVANLWGQKAALARESQRLQRRADDLHKPKVQSAAPTAEPTAPVPMPAATPPAVAALPAVSLRAGGEIDDTRRNEERGEQSSGRASHPAEPVYQPPGRYLAALQAYLAVLSDGLSARDEVEPNPRSLASLTVTYQQNEVNPVHVALSMDPPDWEAEVGWLGCRPPEGLAE
jgi:hypothetical protein